MGRREVGRSKENVWHSEAIEAKAILGLIPPVRCIKKHFVVEKAIVHSVLLCPFFIGFSRSIQNWNQRTNIICFLAEYS